MSAFPVQCNIAHANRIRHSLSHQTQTQQAGIQTSNSIALSADSNTLLRDNPELNKKSTLSDEDILLEKTRAALHRYVNGFKIAGYTQLRLAEQPAAFMRRISLSDVLSNNKPKCETISNAIAKKLIRTTTDGDDTILTSLGASFNTTLPLRTMEFFQKNDYS